jgi:hypothetical protein
VASWGSQTLLTPPEKNMHFLRYAKLQTLIIETMEDTYLPSQGFELGFELGINSLFFILQWGSFISKGSFYVIHATLFTCRNTLNILTHENNSKNSVRLIVDNTVLINWSHYTSVNSFKCLGWIQKLQALW